MRAICMGLVVVGVAACAHSPSAQRSSAPTDNRAAMADGRGEGESPDIRQRPHPPLEVSERTEPPPSEAVSPTPSVDNAAGLDRAAPPPQVPMNAVAGTTEAPSSVSVPSPRPATQETIVAPVRDDAPNTAPAGADIAAADVKLRESVQRALLEAPSLSYTAKRVEVQVAQQQVTLRGEVRTAHERRELDQIVRNLPGVKELRNQVALINASPVGRTP